MFASSLFVPLCERILRGSVDLRLRFRHFESRLSLKNGLQVTNKRFQRLNYSRFEPFSYTAEQLLKRGT